MDGRYRKMQTFVSTLVSVYNNDYYPNGIAARRAAKALRSSFYSLIDSVKVQRAALSRKLVAQRMAIGTTEAQREMRVVCYLAE